MLQEFLEQNGLEVLDERARLAAICMDLPVAPAVRYAIPQFAAIGVARELAQRTGQTLTASDWSRFFGTATRQLGLSAEVVTACLSVWSQALRVQLPSPLPSPPQPSVPTHTPTTPVPDASGVKPQAVAVPKVTNPPPPILTVVDPLRPAIPPVYAGPRTGATPQGQPAPIKLPYSSGFVLFLGLLGLPMCGLLSIPAWLLGSRSLHAIRESGQLQHPDRGVTQAGQILGIIGTAFWGFVWTITLISSLTQNT